MSNVLWHCPHPVPTSPAAALLLSLSCCCCSPAAAAQVAVTDMGLLYTWGAGTDGALGHGNTTSLPFPRLVEFFGLTRPLFVLQAAAGSDVIGAHTLALASPVGAPEQAQVRESEGVRRGELTPCQPPRGS